MDLRGDEVSAREGDAIRSGLLKGEAIREVIDMVRVNARSFNDTAAMLELKQAQQAEDELEALLANQRTGRIVHGDA